MKAHEIKIDVYYNNILIEQEQDKNGNYRNFLIEEVYEYLIPFIKENISLINLMRNNSIHGTDTTKHEKFSDTFVIRMYDKIESVDNITTVNENYIDLIMSPTDNDEFRNKILASYFDDDRTDSWKMTDINKHWCVYESRFVYIMGNRMGTIIKYLTENRQIKYKAKEFETYNEKDIARIEYIRNNPEEIYNAIKDNSDSKIEMMIRGVESSAIKDYDNYNIGLSLVGLWYEKLVNQEWTNSSHPIIYGAKRSIKISNKQIKEFVNNKIKDHSKSISKSDDDENKLINPIEFIDK